MINATILEQPADLERSLPTNAQTAQAAATEFLLDHVGNQLLAGQPHFMLSFLQAVWIVPVELAYLHSGSIGTVGVVAVDAETAQVIAWTPISQMKAASRSLREQHEPSLSEQFQKFLQQQNSHTAS